MGGYSQQVKGVSLNWVMDQDQLNPYVAYEGYVVRVPHNPLINEKGLRLLAPAPFQVSI